MKSLAQTINELAKEYPENLVPCVDHFSIRSGAILLYPHDICVDDIIRFGNASDPDDQAILCLISSPQKGFKGLYVDSYGTYHDELSTEMIHKLGSHSNLKLP